MYATLCDQCVINKERNTCYNISKCFFFNVIRAGFEPTTHSLEGCCSIQLSYRTILFSMLLTACKNSANTAIKKIYENEFAAMRGNMKYPIFSDFCK